MTNFLTRISFNYLFFIALTLFATDARAQAAAIQFSNNNTSSSILQFAKEELKFHLGSVGINEKNTRFAFSFKNDVELKNGAFSYNILKSAKKINVIFSGGDETDMVHAVHGFL
jgi:hypothetical protein